MVLDFLGFKIDAFVLQICFLYAYHEPLDFIKMSLESGFAQGEGCCSFCVEVADWGAVFYVITEVFWADMIRVRSTRNFVGSSVEKDHTCMSWQCMHFILIEEFHGGRMHCISLIVCSILWRVSKLLRNHSCYNCYGTLKDLLSASCQCTHCILIEDFHRGSHALHFPDFLLYCGFLEDIRWTFEYFIIECMEVG